MEEQAVLENHLKSLGFDTEEICVPRFITVPGMEVDKCFNNCIKYCNAYPAWETILGWSIVQLAHSKKTMCAYFSFLFHAVIKHKESGAIVDITPNVSCIEDCLFIPDPVITYNSYYAVRELPACARLMPTMRSLGTCKQCRRYVVEQSLKYYDGKEAPREYVVDIIKCFHLVLSESPNQMMYAIDEDVINEILKNLRKTIDEKGVNWFEK